MQSFRRKGTKNSQATDRHGISLVCHKRLENVVGGNVVERLLLTYQGSYVPEVTLHYTEYSTLHVHDKVLAMFFVAVVSDSFFCPYVFSQLSTVRFFSAIAYCMMQLQIFVGAALLFQMSLVCSICLDSVLAFP